MRLVFKATGYRPQVAQLDGAAYTKEGWRPPHYETYGDGWCRKPAEYRQAEVAVGGFLVPAADVKVMSEQDELFWRDLVKQVDELRRRIADFTEEAFERAEQLTEGVIPESTVYRSYDTKKEAQAAL